MLPRNLVTQMASAATAEIENALRLGVGTMLPPPRAEVGFVAAVTLRAIKDIAAAWKPLLAASRFSLKLSGVFCHAAPMVRFTGAGGQLKCCELADLLIVVDHTTGGVLSRRAALIQAKMAKNTGRVSLSGKSSHDQVDLYQNWYPFDFVEKACGIDVLPALPSVMSRVCSGYAPRWGGLRMRPA
jgi:hypothetical protein